MEGVVHSHEHERTDPATCLLCSHKGKERCAPPPPLSPTAGRRAGPEVIRAGELALPITCCSTWKSRPYSSPGQYSRAGCRCGALQVSRPPGCEHRKAGPASSLVCNVTHVGETPFFPPSSLLIYGRELTLESRMEELAMSLTGCK